MCSKQGTTLLLRWLKIFAVIIYRTCSVQESSYDIHGKALHIFGNLL
jgi:hypothetical protein